MHVKLNADLSVTNSPGAIGGRGCVLWYWFVLVCCFDGDGDERCIVVVEQCCVVVINDEFAVSWCVVQHECTWDDVICVSVIIA